MYKMKCATPGENVLAQKILFSKGYCWAAGQTYPLYTTEGQHLFLYAQEGEIFRCSLEEHDEFERRPHKEIGFKELMKL